MSAAGICARIGLATTAGPLLTVHPRFATALALDNSNTIAKSPSRNEAGFCVSEISIRWTIAVRCQIDTNKSVGGYNVLENFTLGGVSSQTFG